MHTVYGGIRFFGIYILIGWNFDDFNLVQESEFYDALRWTILGEGEHMIKTKNEIEWIGAAKTWTGQNAEGIKPKTLGWLELLIHWINYNFGLKKKIEINMCATGSTFCTLSLRMCMSAERKSRIEYFLLILVFVVVFAIQCGYHVPSVNMPIFKWLHSYSLQLFFLHFETQLQLYDSRKKHIKFWWFRL